MRGGVEGLGEGVEGLGVRRLCAEFLHRALKGWLGGLTVCCPPASPCVSPQWTACLRRAARRRRQTSWWTRWVWGGVGVGCGRGLEGASAPSCAVQRCIWRPTVCLGDSSQP